MKLEYDLINGKEQSGLDESLYFIIGTKVNEVSDTSLSSTFYKANIATINIPSSVTTINASCFAGYINLKSINLGNVSTIGNYAFSGCQSLTSIDIPNSVETIGDGAFTSASNLTDVKFGNSLESIGTSAFSGTNLTGSLIIPNSVTTIKSGAFSSLSNLTEVTIGESIATIGNAAFGGCSNLNKVTILATTPPSISSPFLDVGENLVIYVPAESVNDYKIKLDWAVYIDNIQAIPES